MKNIAYKAIEEFGRDGFYVKKSSRQDCPDCIAGPSGQSISACNTCDSNGYLEQAYFVPIYAIISWKTMEEQSVLIGGIVLSGDCAVAISADDYRSIDRFNDGFYIDGTEVFLSKVVPSEQNAVYLLSFKYNE